MVELRREEALCTRLCSATIRLLDNLRVAVASCRACSWSKRLAAHSVPVSMPRLEARRNGILAVLVLSSSEEQQTRQQQAQQRKHVIPSHPDPNQQDI